MEYVLNSIQMKAIDDYSIKKTGIPSVVLMERAALAVSDELFKMEKGSVLVVCGRGNNGADGLAVARILSQRGFEVDILLVSDNEGTEEYNIQKSIIINMGLHCVNKAADATYDYIVDAIFGIGLSREVTGHYKDIIEDINSLNAYRLAVDIPSGINASTGEVMGIAVKADKTVTFGYKKIGLLCGRGKFYSGIVTVKDIGFVCGDVFRTLDVRTFAIDMKDIQRLPKHAADYDKGKCGKTLIIAGSKEMCGAACLSARAAFRAGCGLVRVFTHIDNRTPLMVKVPEALPEVYDSYTEREAAQLEEMIAWADCIVAGPGLSTRREAVRIINDTIRFIEQGIWETAKTLIFDADALNIIAADSSLMVRLKHCDRARIIITPHIGEAARLLREDIVAVKEHPIASGIKLFEMMCDACVLKDAATITAGSSGVYINTSGNCGMATAGAGDVLTGIMAGVACLYKNEKNRAVPPEWIAATAVYIHGCCGNVCKQNIGINGTVAWDIAEAVTKLL